MSISPEEALSKAKVYQGQINEDNIKYYVDYLTQLLTTGFNGKEVYQVFDMPYFNAEMQKGIADYFADHWNIEFMNSVTVANKTEYPKIGLNQTLIVITEKV